MPMRVSGVNRVRNFEINYGIDSGMDKWQRELKSYTLVWRQYKMSLFLNI